MDKPKSLQDYLSRNTTQKDIYSTDKEVRQKRSKKGYFSNGDDNHFDFIHLIKSWNIIVGEMLSKNTIPQKISRGTLLVITKHPIFAQELGLISPQIIQKIEKNIPPLRGRINKIKYIHNNFSWESFQEKQKEPTQKQQEIARKLHPFSPEFKLKKIKAQEIFKDIDDFEFRELLISLFILKDE